MRKAVQDGLSAPALVNALGPALVEFEYVAVMQFGPITADPNIPIRQMQFGISLSCQCQGTSAQDDKTTGLSKGILLQSLS